MKKQIIKFIGFCVCFLCCGGSLWSQDLYVNSGGQLSVAAGEVLYAGSSTTVDALGSFMIVSDASKSGSFISGASVTGNISYSRYIDDTNWHLVSSPVSGQSIASFVGDAGNSVTTNGGNGNFAVARYKSENDPGSRWTYHNTSPSGVNQETLSNFNNGQGYSMNRTASGAFVFSGTMATSDVAVSLTYSGSADHYWSCIGNPFPSFLPANDNASGTNVLGQNLSFLDTNFAALYLWDGATYQVINQASGALQLAPGQAFMVKAKDASETFTFTESLQNHQSGNDNFYRNPDLTPRIRVTLNDGVSTKQTEIKYLSNATTGLDVGYDAGAYVDSAPSVSIDTHLVADSQGVNFALQYLPDTNYEDMVVPLSVKADAGTELTFDAVIDHLPDGLDVYLNDVVNGSFTKITNINEAYTVTLDSDLAGIGRFYLYTSTQALSVDNPVVLQQVSVYAVNNSLVRVTGLPINEQATVKVYDITGKQLLSTAFTTELVKDITLPSGIRTGLYIVNLVTEKGAIIKKIMIE